jgi:hypothetical protein
MKILISGCSYTESQNWPEYLFDSENQTVVNLAKGGSGNYHISNTVTYNIDKINPDFVFVLWSGINRIDMRVPNSYLFEQYRQDGNYGDSIIGNSMFFLSGHAVDAEKGWLAGYNNIRGPDWPEIQSLKDWFNLPDNLKKECLDHQINLSTNGGKENTAAFVHQHFVVQNMIMDRTYLSELTFQNMVNCFNTLKVRNIPYRFSFIYDIWNRNEYFTHGRAVKEHYHDQIDWDKFIDLPPFQYGLKHDLIGKDGYHLTREGMNQWARQIQDILKKQKDLQHFFKS